MYCENLAETFGESLVGTWCHEEEGSLILAPGLDGFATNAGGKVGTFSNLSGAKTIIAWGLASQQLEHTSPIACLRSEGSLDAGWLVWVTPEGRILYGTGDASYSDEKVYDPTAVRRGGVFFIAIVRDNEKVITFHNGVKSDINYLTSDESPATDLYIGHDPIIPWNKFQGLLQCVSVFDRALTDEEVASIYNAGSTSL